MAEKRVFLRDATGLVRTFGAWDSFGLQFGGITTAVGLSTLFYSFNFLRGANILISLIIFLPILIAYLIADTQLGISMPRSGGDYVYASRILHPSIGMMASWMLVFLLVLNPGFLSDLITTGYIPGLLTAIGMGAQSSAFSDVTVRFILDNIIIAFCAMFVIIPVRHYTKVQTGFMIFAILGAFMIPAALLALGHQGFVAAVNKSPISYDAVIAKAQSLGSTEHFSWVDTILVIPGLGLFLITNWPCAVGGEIKDIKKSLTIGNVGAGIVSWLIFFVTAWAYYSVLGTSFASSVAYLTVNSPADSPFGAGGNLLTSILQFVYGGSWITFLVFFCLLAAAFICVAQSIFLSTRHIFAWAFDGVIPSKFANVNDRLGTPVFTTTAIWIMSEVVLLVILFQSSALTIVLNAGIGVPLGYAPALFAAMLFSRNRKDIFDRSPSIVRFKIGGIYASTLLGMIGGVGFIVIVAFTAAFPQAGYPITPWNVAFEVLMFIVGGVVYYASKYYRQGHDVDLSLAFKEIPPE